MQPFFLPERLPSKIPEKGGSTDEKNRPAAVRGASFGRLRIGAGGTEGRRMRKLRRKNRYPGSEHRPLRNPSRRRRRTEADGNPPHRRREGGGHASRPVPGGCHGG